MPIRVRPPLRRGRFPVAPVSELRLHPHSILLQAPAAQRLLVSAGAIGPGKKWEKRELTANGKPVFQKIHVKKGDTVVVSACSGAIHPVPHATPFLLSCRACRAPA